MTIDGKEILITGGTGSLSHALTKTLLRDYKPKGIRLMSRNEKAQYLMKQTIKEWGYKGDVSFIIGDVRDYRQVMSAMHNVNIVVHCAALKHVLLCENNPLEAVKTNITGAVNIIDAAKWNKSVEKIFAISTDKATAPVTLYGATKAVSERLFISGNILSEGKQGRPLMSIARYGNVIASNGSVIPLWKDLIEKGEPLPITDKRMTRFWITLPKVAQFIIDCIGEMKGKEIFIPKMPSMNMLDMAKALKEDCEIREIGILPGEKLHECLYTKEESRFMTEDENKYIIHVPGSIEEKKEDISYCSNNNERWLEKDELLSMIEEG